MSFDYGISPLSGLLPYLVKHGIVQASGGWYSVDVDGKTSNFQSGGPFHAGFEQFILSDTGAKWLNTVLERKFV